MRVLDVKGVRAGGAIIAKRQWVRAMTVKKCFT